MQNMLRTIPAVDQILSEAQADPGLSAYPRPILVEAIRTAVQAIRMEMLAGHSADIAVPSLLYAVKKILLQQTTMNLKRIINATGVIIHTNLGRAPFSLRAKAAVDGVLEGYSTVEFDLQHGVRGERNSLVESKLCALTGAEAALVVNNNAAAVMLVLSSLAKEQEVIISRGQLVEIGGSFRIPEVLRQSGARLVEVGTTNRTNLADYEQAISGQTAAIMKVHTSNYRIIGFVSQPEEKQLTDLARQHGIVSINDLGSGTLLPMNVNGYQEKTVQEAVKEGFDIVTFSGDKLLGGGQAGIIVGKEKYLKKMKANHLLRALRMDKLCLAALEGTLLDYLIGFPAIDIPVQAMLRRETEELRQQAMDFAKRLAPLIELGWKVDTIELESWTGGGAFPAVELRSYGLRLCAIQVGLSASQLEKYFRNWTIPIIARVHNDEVVIDVRCLLDSDEEEIIAACQQAGKEMNK
ncbi:MAG: selA [Firmicutes bacterium]|nr:selA [Bacillota bacterium]